MLRVFISHSHEEKALALAWQTLLDHTSQGAIEIWLSSDTKPSGGIEIGGEWRDSIYEKLAAADFVLAIVSPKTVDRPWILWECGMASGTNKDRGLIPIVFSMPVRELDGPLQVYQAYSGEDRQKVTEICERLAVYAQLSPKSQYWDPMIESYISTIKLHRPPRRANQSTVETWYRRIDDFLRAGRESELAGLAKQMYASLGSDSAVDMRIHDLLSKVFLETGQYDLSLQEVDRALALYAEDLNLLHRKVLIYLELGNTQAAEDTLDAIHRDFNEARDLPEIAGAEGRLKRILYDNGGGRDYLLEAIEAYKRAYRLDSLNYYCGVNVVSLSLTAGETDTAKRVAQDVLEVCRGLQAHGAPSYWADFTIGELHLVLGDVDTAIVEYGRGLNRNPPPGDRSKLSALNGVKRLVKLGAVPQDRLSEFQALLG